MNKQEVQFVGIALAGEPYGRNMIIKYLEETRANIMVISASEPVHLLIPAIVAKGKIPVVHDMHNEDVNDLLFRVAARDGFPILCLNVEPDDESKLRFHYRVDNSKNEMRSLVLQLENVISRYRALRRSNQVNAYAGQLVRVVDQNDNFFWQNGVIVDEDDLSVEVEFTVKRKILRTNLVPGEF